MLTVLDVTLPDDGRTKLGRLGVLFFFVHTALVLMASIERQGTSGSGWVRDFYVRRALRIYPLAIATIVLALIFAIPEQLVVPAVAATPYSARTIVSNLALVQNLTADPNILGVLWTLPLELQMYLMLPICYLAATRSTRAMLALVLVFIAAGAVVSHVHVRGFARLSVLSFAPCFAGGVLAYHLLGRRARPSLASTWWPVAILLIGTMALTAEPSFAHPEVGWLPCLVLGLVIPHVRDAGPSVVTRASEQVCRVSYGVYLLHEPVLWLSFVVLARFPMAARWVSFVVLIIALPTLAYRLVERPGIELGRRLTNRPVNARLEVGAP